MATKCKRDTIRETEFVDYVSNQPVIVNLKEGGKVVEMHAKGRRKHYKITIEQMWIQGGKNAAEYQQ